MNLKILLASVHDPVPKLLPRMQIFVSAMACFSGLILISIRQTVRPQHKRLDSVLITERPFLGFGGSEVQHEGAGRLGVC